MNNDILFEELNGEEQATIAGGDGASTPQNPPFFGGPGFGGIPFDFTQDPQYQFFKQQQEYQAYMDWNNNGRPLTPQPEDD